MAKVECVGVFLPFVQSHVSKKSDSLTRAAGGTAHFADASLFHMRFSPQGYSF